MGQPRGLLHAERYRALSSFIGCNIRRFWKIVFIVQGKPGGTEESVQIIKETRVEAWEAVSDLLDDDIEGNPIRVAGHCYGCTAAQGSSCGGALKQAAE